MKVPIKIVHFQSFKRLACLVNYNWYFFRFHHEIGRQWRYDSFLWIGSGHWRLRLRLKFTAKWCIIFAPKFLNNRIKTLNSKDVELIYVYAKRIDHTWIIITECIQCLPFIVTFINKTTGISGAKFCAKFHFQKWKWEISNNHIHCLSLGTDLQNEIGIQKWKCNQSRSCVISNTIPISGDQFPVTNNGCDYLKLFSISISRNWVLHKISLQTHKLDGKRVIGRCICLKKSSNQKYNCQTHVNWHANLQKTRPC